MVSLATFRGIEGLQAAVKALALLQLTTYLWPQQAEVKDGDRYDFIIVGAGTAGCVIANRLTENPNTSVLLIEAGGDPPFESDLPASMALLKRSRYDWNFTSEDDRISDQCHQTPYFEMSLGRMLGGSSSLNYHAYFRGYPVDYDSWAEVTKDSNWKWKNVLPFFKKAERLDEPDIINSPSKEFYGTDGYLGVTKENSIDLSNYLNSFKELGHNVITDYNPNQPLGYTGFLVTVANGQRQSSATAYLSPIKDRSNLNVLKNSMVTKIVLEGKKAVGVEALLSDGKTIVVKANKEVIVSAGVFNSPKLLMLSGIGPKEHLESKGIEVVADLPVGENLQDHVGAIVLHKMEELQRPFIPFNPHVFPVSTFSGFTAFDKAQKYPDYGNANFIVGTGIIGSYCSFAYRFNHKICDEILKNIGNRMAVFNQILLLDPKSRGKVLLRSTNPVDSPLIYTGQFSNNEDLDNLVKYILDLNPVLNTTYYKSVNAELVDPIPTKCKEFAPDSKEYWRCYAQCVSSSMSHFTSTCPMGTVLDGRLKVLGLEGLRVADGSIMPKIVRGHPAGTIFMIGEKAADIIKQDYKL